MAKKQPSLTYTFEDPNTSREFEELLQRVILQKLLACHKEESLANHV